MAIVDGCNGTGIDGKDYCFKPPTGTLVLMGDDMAPIRNFPLGVCEGGMCCSVARFFFVKSPKRSGMNLTCLNWPFHASDCDEDSDCAGE